MHAMVRAAERGESIRAHSGRRLLSPVVLFTIAETHPTEPSSDYSKEGLVVEHYVTRVSFQADGNSVREVNSVVRMQGESAVRSWAVLRFPYSSSYETVDVDYVRVRKLDGTVVVTPDYNTQEMTADVTRAAPLYCDLREKHVAVKALGVGDTLEYLIRYRTLRPTIPGQFWFEYSFPKDAIVKDEELDVTVPRDKYVNATSPELKPQTKDEGSSRTYVWKGAQLVRVEKAGSPQAQPAQSRGSAHNLPHLGRGRTRVRRSAENSNRGHSGDTGESHRTDEGPELG
jgi:hypothetical protein